MTLKGDISNRERRLQIVSMSDLRYGQITPTDIDGALDFGGKLFIFFELKLKDALFPTGQRIFAENLTKNIKCPAYYIVARHNVKNTNQDVIASNAVVSDCYLNGRRLRVESSYTLGNLIDGIRENHAQTNNQ